MRNNNNNNKNKKNNNNKNKKNNNNKWSYSSNISLKLTRAQSEKLLSRIIGKKVNSTECTIKKRAINMVHNVLTNNDVCENFNDYFAINYHAKNTRNRNTLLKLPRVKLEFTKRTFKYMGVNYIMIYLWEWSKFSEII